MKAIRHGDLALIQVEGLPKGLKASRTNTLLKMGSGGNPHMFKGGTFYPHEDEFVLGYLKAKGTRLFHAEHGKKSGEKIPDGVYEVRKQVEYTHQGLRPVID